MFKASIALAMVSLITFGSVSAAARSHSLREPSASRSVARQLQKTLRHSTEIQLEDVPADIKALYTHGETVDVKTVFAQGAEPWQCSCLPNGLPAYKLSFVAQRKNYYVVCYKVAKGGVSHCADVFRYEGGHVRLWKKLQLWSNPTTLTEFITALNNSNFGCD